MFEASPSSAHVLAAANALQWDFPGRAAEISFDEFLNESFQESLATLLEQASVESLKRFEAHTVKAKTSVVETRDTTDPALVTQMLMPLLEAIGSSVDVPRLRKRVRDDINIRNAERPWRRLPLWLVLRVATQRQLCLGFGDEIGRAYYKFLMCILLAQLLEDGAGQLAPELTIMLRAKLCRRLAKLEMDKTRAPSASAVYKQLFASVGPFAKAIIERATEQVASAWTNFKRTITRPIPKLPARAGKQDLRLSLPNSEKYLLNLLAMPRAQRGHSASLRTPPLSDSGMEEVTKFADRYFRLTQLEREIELDESLVPQSEADCEARCRELAKSITGLFAAVGSAYDANPEQMSIFILSLFDLWVQMDRCAVKACPLLRGYHPVFSPELLDVLHLPTLSDMRRLRDIQNYLQDRCRSCQPSQKTIFSEPDQDCFAVRYLEQSTRLYSLRQRIVHASDRSRERKKVEWERACKEYDDLSEQIADGTCVCSINPDGSRNVKGCRKCWHSRCRRRMAINIHEDFLPEDSAQKAAVLLELDMPSYLEAYRNATWRIFNDLGHPSKPETSSSPVTLLKDCSQLIPYVKSTAHGVSLASTSKSFLKTHYKAIKMKVKLAGVLLPFGPYFSYYDVSSGTWLKDQKRSLTFQHLCGIYVPDGLQSSVIRPSAHPAPDTNGPSSYQIVANQTKCPLEMSSHEFMAYQRLLSGKNRRWLAMIVELGASNINFSSRDTMAVFSQLAVQAGPSQHESGPLRDAHLVFREQSFCQRLAEQIENRLRSISSNWREVHCMEMLITLSIRLFTLTSGPDHHFAEKLLKVARTTTLQWVSRLRDEVRNTAEADAAGQVATYGFWAALLCRRTFTIMAGRESAMNAEELCSFVQGSLALQENLVVDLAKLSQNLKNMLVRDMKMAHQVRSLTRRSIQSNPDSLGAAINQAWSDSASFTGRTYGPWQFISSANDRWVTSTITSTVNDLVVSQTVHYNFIEGHLLVDGKPLGKLPRDIRESEDVKELFGNQHLLTFPSPLAGMSNVMATRIHEHEIHFGLRGNNAVIQAITRDGVLEYVPRRVFVNDNTFDLPVALIDNCVHWFNIHFERLVIRRKSTMWRTKMSDWVLDISNRLAQRNRVLLMDPHSDVCKKVAGIFRHFEDPERLTVFQPLAGHLSVELRHLDLSFFVNRRGLLECRELRAEIDPNQDAGTLYGFESKIVLRDVDNIDQRSIIIGLGQLSYKRHGMHVAVRARSGNEYGRFGIDDILGRLTCPPEPRILYSKAQFHAVTSFVLSDPLTGRTGTEEALHILRSGYCQPWTPLSDVSATILQNIKKLSPTREYYPKDKKRMQSVIWDLNRTVPIQQDTYETLVQEILAKSDRLHVFAARNEEGVRVETEIPSHLRQRGQIRRLLYERNVVDSAKLPSEMDKVYKSRDRHVSLPQATNVYQITRLIRERPFRTQTTRNLASILGHWKWIGGFQDTPEILSNCLSDLIENNISEQWGSLVDFCRRTGARNPYRLIFRLGLLSFGTNADMSAIKSLASFGCIDELKVLQPPSVSSFVDFKLWEYPTLESLLSIIAAHYPNLETNKIQSKAKQDRAHERHRTQCEEEGRRLAQFLLEQWPSSSPSADAFVSTVIDVDSAFERILAEWQRLLHNVELLKYVLKAQKILDRHRGAVDMPALRTWNAKPTGFLELRRGAVIPSLSGDLVVKQGAWLLDCSTFEQDFLPSKNISRDVHSSKERKDILPAMSRSKGVVELGTILDSLARSSNILRQQYGDNLKSSLTAFEKVSNLPQVQKMPPGVNFVKETIPKSRLGLLECLDRIRTALSAEDDRFQWLRLGNLWPCTSPVSLLEQLRSSSGHRFGKGMREGLVSYGILATQLQWLLRIKHAQLKQDHHKLLEEWQHAGHENWIPLHRPDWLLLEIDSNIFIRHEQIDVAHAIISPQSGSNSVLQMNMGKGKPSHQAGSDFQRRHPHADNPR